MTRAHQQVSGVRGPAADASAAEPPREPTMPPQRRRLGEVLVAAGVLTDDDLTQALVVQLEPGNPRRRIGQVVVELGLATERQVAEALAGHLKLELADLSKEPVSVDAVRLVPQVVAERNRVAVLERTGGRVRIAMSDPTNVVALDDVRLYTGATDVSVVVALDSQVRDLLHRAWTLPDDAVGVVEEDLDDSVDAALVDAADEAPTVRLANAILVDAVRGGASDVHVEPQRDRTRVRYRVDGMLRDVMTLARSGTPALVSRLKIVSGMDIAERRLPQEGRTRLSVDGVTVDARVSTMPALHGEKVVVRLFPPADSVLPLERLGLHEGQLDALRRALAAPQGLVVITGPTGSGKTSTLYSSIREISDPAMNVVTLEDPIELQVPGITQVQTNERSGLTFARGLRSVLRQDPDVVLLGEIRDADTARLALRASLTGHLVLTTLHTNSPAAALTRLVDMGAEPFLVASSLSCVVAQRLVRRPCDACSEPYTPDDEVLRRLGLPHSALADAAPRRATGCGDCAGTGYRGRRGVFEVLEVTAGLRSVLLHTPTEAAVRAAVRAGGVRTLRSEAVDAAIRGATTFEEALRVTQVDAGAARHCPACERSIAEDMVACPWCAQDLDLGSCATCASPLDPGWQVCPWCRRRTE